MFWPDVVSLKAFYASHLGQFSAQLIRSTIKRVWPHAQNEVVLGLGYALPYLSLYLEPSNHVFAAMPAGQGVVHWPKNGPNASMVCEEGQLPLASNSVNRVVVVHAVENAEFLREMLEEIWRVLMPSGRLFVVVPNRAGLWARAEDNPFAHGHAFSANQLKRLISAHHFTPLQHGYALYLPPSSSVWVLKCARLIEGLGRSFFPAFGGVVWMEAEKQIYAPIRVRATRPSRSILAPAMGTASARAKTNT